MSERKKLFRRVLDALMEGRARQARRYVERYRKAHEPVPPREG